MRLRPRSQKNGWHCIRKSYDTSQAVPHTGFVMMKPQAGSCQKGGEVPCLAQEWGVGGAGIPPSFFGEGVDIPPLTFWTGSHSPRDYVRKGKFSRDSIGNRGRVRAAGGGACLSYDRGEGVPPSWFEWGVRSPLSKLGQGTSPPIFVAEGFPDRHLKK